MAKILAVDDQLTIRELVSVILKSQGHIVHTATNGIEGLQQAQDGGYDLVITDVHMPKMDGIEFVAKIRQYPDYKYTPILMLTTDNSSERKANARMMGASGWLTKPFDSTRLSSAVKKLLAKTQS
jgi:two-component system chemotaxis response regulator CheY